MAEYYVEIPVHIFVEANSPYEAWEIACRRMDALTSDASYLLLPEEGREYSRAKVAESLRSRKARLGQEEGK